MRDIASEPLEVRSYEQINIEVEEEKPPKEELQRDFDNSIFIAKIDEFLNERKK